MLTAERAGSAIPTAEDDSPLPPVAYGHGFSIRKRVHLRRFVPQMHITFVRNGASVPDRGMLFLWGSASAPPGTPAAVEIVRMEDGFLRSVGLGADLVRPISWVMDRRGIYYDSTQPSQLEHILQTQTCSAELLARAARLRDQIVVAGITKYSVGGQSWRRPRNQSRVVLVIGQVESDASLRYGAPKIRTNLALARAARRANPSAYLVYKPHPDVVAGLRAKGPREAEISRWCDEIVTDAPMSIMLTEVDAVHVLTSLAGFEALLRGKGVVCHGQPFYSGWGLTHDEAPVERRRHRVNLDELVAAALIRYPLYVSRFDGRRIGPEQAVEELISWRARSSKTIRPWQPLWRSILRLTVGQQ
jgi:capsular polysaccharide export protein